MQYKMLYCIQELRETFWFIIESCANCLMWDSSEMDKKQDDRTPVSSYTSNETTLSTERISLAKLLCKHPFANLHDTQDN
jgi:hypothetical protein